MTTNTLFSTLALVLVSVLGYGQISMSVSATGPTSEAACDGSINATVDGAGTVLGNISLYPGGTSQFSMNASGANATQICSDSIVNTFFEIVNETCARVFLLHVSSPFPFGTDMVVSDLDVDESLSFNVEFDLPTSEFSGDGSISITDQVGVASVEYYSDIIFDFSLVALGSFLPIPPVTGTGNSLDGLNTGGYLVSVYGTNGDNTMIGVVLEPEELATCNDSIMVTPIVTPAYDNVQCDGSVITWAWGTVGPYSYEHLPSGATEDTVTGLCDGLYEVTVTDQANNSTTSPYIVPAMFNVVNSVNWPFDPGYDTLFSTAAANCDLDFNQPIDSVFISEVHLLDEIVCEAVWHFYQGGEVYTITHQYAYDGISNYLLSLGVYCENGRAAELGYYFAYDQFDFSQASQVGIREQKISTVEVSPNPSSGLFNLSTSSLVQGIEITNVSGRMVLQTSGQTNTLDLTDQPSGVYLLRVITDDGIGYSRLTKQ